MSEIFLGYCFPVPGGWHTPAVVLNSPKDVFRYTQLQGKWLFREVRITDATDQIVVQMIDGKYVWPEEWKVLNGGATDGGPRDQCEYDLHKEPR